MSSEVTETQVAGLLKLLEGNPVAEMIRTACDNPSTAIATVAVLTGEPFAKMRATLGGLRSIGIEPGEIAATKLELTPITDTGPSKPAIMGFCSHLDLGDGPVVLEVPSEVKGVVVDAGFRVLADICPSTSNESGCERHLFIPPEYTGEIPSGFLVSSSSSENNLVVLFALVNADFKDSQLESLQERLNIYPLGLAGDPPPEIFHCQPDEHFNATLPADFRFFDELNAVVQSEPAEALPANLTTALASIGILKGQSFNPDNQMIRVLNEAVAIGSAAVQVLASETCEPDASVIEAWERTLSFTNGERKLAFNSGKTKPSKGAPGETIQSFCNLTFRS